MGAASVQQMADRVAVLMEQRLRVHGKGLRAKLRRGGRRLPRRIRREAEVLAEAAEKAQVPKLLLHLDHARVAEAYDACIGHLNAVGRSARLRAYFLDLLTAVALIAVVVAALLIAVLVWRGFL